MCKQYSKRNTNLFSSKWRVQNSTPPNMSLTFFWKVKKILQSYKSITHTIDSFSLSSADVLLFFFSSLKLFTLYFCKDVYNFLWKGWETTTKLQIIKFVFRLKAKVIAIHGRRVLHRNMKKIIKEICSCGWNRRILMKICVRYEYIYIKMHTWFKNNLLNLYEIRCIVIGDLSLIPIQGWG